MAWLIYNLGLYLRVGITHRERPRNILEKESTISLPTSARSFTPLCPQVSAFDQPSTSLFADIFHERPLTTSDATTLVHAAMPSLLHC